MYVAERKYPSHSRVNIIFKTSPITMYLIILMISISLIRYLLIIFIKIDINDAFSLVPYRVIEHGEIWTLLTNIFLHDDLLRNPFHLIANMIALFYIGRYVERVLGGEDYLLAFIATGLGGSILIVLSNLLLRYLHYQSNYYSHYLGASGAILGIFAILALYRPKISILFFLFIPPYLIIPILAPLKWSLLIQFTLDLVLGVMNLPYDYIAHFGHVGGMISGFLLYRIYLEKKLYVARYSYDYL